MQPKSQGRTLHILHSIFKKHHFTYIHFFMFFPWSCYVTSIYWLHLMFCWPCIAVYQYSKTNKMHFLYSVYYELMASTCFQHHLLIFRRCCTNNSWYVACVLCLLAATRIEVELVTPILVAANIHNTHTTHQLLFLQCLLKMSKWCSKHVDAVNS
jgi:hypothetical protein